MSQVAKAQEPSMEEILASIRRIIADDEAAKPAAVAPAPAAAAPVATPAPAKPEAVAPPLEPKPAAPPAPPPAPPAPAAEAMSQDDIDAMLADFDSVPGEAVAEPEAEPEPEPPAADEVADVLELTEAMEVRIEPAARSSVDIETDVVFAEPPPAALPEPEPEPPPAPLQAAMPVHAPPSPRPVVPAASLLSEQATQAVTTAFGSLAHTVIVQNGRTLDDLVREMLRPMLKGWLDENLPGIVERLVRAEIERLARGQG